MPRIDWNSIDSLAGGIAGGYQSTQDRKARQKQIDTENAFQQQRATRADEESQRQRDHDQWRLEQESEAQRAAVEASQPLPEGVSTRMEQLGPHFGKMDPKDIPHLQQYALERDYQDSVAHEIEADLQTGALNDSDPEGKSVPNPQRAQQAQADLETLKRTALPPQVVEKIQQRRAIEKADLIGAKTQQSVRKFTLEKHQAQLQDAFARGVDLSEAALLFHTIEADPDPAKWMQRPENARAWQLALDGKAEVHGPDGRSYVVTAQSRDDVQRMAWENAQLKQAMQTELMQSQIDKNNRGPTPKEPTATQDPQRYGANATTTTGPHGGTASDVPRDEPGKKLTPEERAKSVEQWGVDKFESREELRAWIEDGIRPKFVDKLKDDAAKETDDQKQERLKK